MKNVRVVVNTLSKFIDQIIKAVVLDVVANLRRAPSEGGTPVDTGWASSNWIPNIGSKLNRPAGSREAAEAGSLPRGQQDSSLAAIAAGYRAELGPIFISNAVPYIVKLNEGSSKQAPAGFVQAGIVKAVMVDLPKKLVGGVRDAVTGGLIQPERIL